MKGLFKGIILRVWMGMRETEGLAKDSGTSNRRKP